jgi:hypothetical protein
VKLQRLGIALVLVGVPLMLLAPALPPQSGKWAVHKQDWLLGLTIAVALISLALYLLPTPLFPQRRSTLPLIVFGTAILIVGVIGWNKTFRNYVATHRGYNREVFRRKARTFHWPIYGRYDNSFARWDAAKKRYHFTTLPFALASAAVAGIWYAWARRRPLDKPWDARSVVILIALQLATIVVFAACEPWPDRFGLHISGYDAFRQDVSAFHGIRDTLAHYVERSPHLGWYGQHYPPGNLLLIEAEREAGIPGATKAFVCLCTVLSVIPLIGLARELELDAVTTSAAVLLFTATSGVLILCTINTTSLLLLPGTTCLWALARGLRTGSILAAAVLGFAYAFYLMFSFSASILGVLMALATLIGWWNGAFTIRNVLRTGVVALLTLAILVAAQLLLTHFNLVACFITAVRGHQKQQGNEGFDDAKRYLLRSSGNVIAYLVSVVPLGILAAAGATRSATPRAAKSLFVALLVSIVIAGFSGLFYLETERIWIFLTPFVALAAGYELARRSESEGRHVIHITLLLVLLISCTQEWFFTHYR